MTRVVAASGGIRLRSKYGAEPTRIGDRVFASKAEARRAQELQLLERAGEIERLEYQPRFVLCAHPRCAVTLDFRYYDRRDNRTHIEDIKGVLTRDMRTRLLWLREQYGVVVELVNAQGERWTL